jgi:hypothetical protein
LKTSPDSLEKSASTVAAPSKSESSRILEGTETGGGVKIKAKLLAEQSSAIIDIAANFKATVDSRTAKAISRG